MELVSYFSRLQDIHTQHEGEYLESLHTLGHLGIEKWKLVMMGELDLPLHLSLGKVDPTDPDIVSYVNSLREILHIPAVTASVPVVKPVKEETSEMVTITSPRTTSNSIMSSALLNDTFKLARVILQYNTDIANNKVTKILSKDNIIDNLTTTLPALTPLQILLS
jgi:hypothetical protein